LTDTPQKKEDDSSKLIPRDSTPDQYRTMDFKSPLPPPEYLKGYDLIRPDLLDIAISGVKEEAQHRRDLEIKESQHKMDLDKGEQSKSWAGLYLGFIIVVGVVYVASDLIKTGHDAAGGGLVVGLAALVAIFVSNSRK
jgi:uncharacterized membrane protein